MKIKVEPVFACGDRYEVKMQVAQGSKWPKEASGSTSG